MLGVNQLDFINYTTAFKGNYRKGVHKLETILANPTHAAEFAANLGGVSVVLGVPIGKEDKNSEVLLSLLLASSVADAAAYTWLGQFYEFASWDELLGDASRCLEMMDNPMLWRAVKGSSMVVGKSVATIAGLSCVNYADMEAVVASQEAMTAVAASSTAMAAVAASQTAMAAVIASDIALSTVVASQTAMTAVAASQAAMTAMIASSTALTVMAASSTAMTAVAASSTAMTAMIASQAAMAAVAASPTAMAAIWQNETALTTVQNNTEAWATFTGASSEVIGKTVAILAGLDPAGYADMAAVAASSTAMSAVIASETAIGAIATSTVAQTAINGSSTALDAVKAASVALVPTMTSNNTPKGVVSTASGSDSAYKAFDGDDSSIIYVPKENSWVQYQVPGSCIVSKFSFRNNADGSYALNSHGYIDVSIDGVTFNSVYNFNNLTPGTTHTIDMKKIGGGRFIRLRLNGKNNTYGDGSIRIATAQFYGLFGR